MTARAPRAALYARVSTTGKGQDINLQLDELHQVAEQRGWTVVGSYADDGVSGAKDRRPELDRMMGDAQAGKVDIIAVWKLDRLARSVRHLLDVADSLTACGVDLVSVRDAHVDTTSPSGRFTLQILGAVAELERALIQERVQAGVDRARAAGKHCGRPVVEIDLRPALAMLDLGHGLKATASAMGVSRTTLRQRLTEAGEWPRPRGVGKSPPPGPA